jgi:hypothetical protein
MDEAVVLVPEMWAALARTATLAWACAPGQRGPRRRLWHLRDWFRDGGLQPADHTRHLVLTRGELLNGFPQRAQALRYLLQLLWVEGSGSRRFRRDVLWCSLRNGYRLLFGTGRWLRPADRDPTRNDLPGPRRPTKFRSLCRNYLLACIAVRLPSQSGCNTN